MTRSSPPSLRRCLDPQRTHPSLHRHLRELLRLIGAPESTAVALYLAPFLLDASAPPERNSPP